jgi:hypothetical protein
MLHSIYEIVPMTLCIESESVIMPKNWCGKLRNCARDPATEIGLRSVSMGVSRRISWVLIIMSHQQFCLCGKVFMRREERVSSYARGVSSPSSQSRYPCNQIVHRDSPYCQESLVVSFAGPRRFSKPCKTAHQYILDPAQEKSTPINAFNVGKWISPN